MVYHFFHRISQTENSVKISEYRTLMNQFSSTLKKGQSQYLQFGYTRLNNRWRSSIQYKNGRKQHGFVFMKFIFCCGSSYQKQVAFWLAAISPPPPPVTDHDITLHSFQLHIFVNTRVLISYNSSNTFARPLQNPHK